MSKASSWSAGIPASGVNKGVPRSTPSRSYAQAWYGHWKNRSTLPCSVSQSFVPRWRQKLWCARSSPERFRQTISERPPTSTTTKLPGSATSSVTHTGTHELPKIRSRSRAWNSGDVYASGISVDARSTGSRVAR